MGQCENHESNLQKQFSVYLTQAFTLMHRYEWLANSYVAEFFINNSWEKFPVSWRKCFEELTLEEIANNIMTEKKNKTFRFVWPLSLLAFISSCHSLSLNRTQKKSLPTKDEIINQSKIFSKHIKPKKRHELSLFPNIIHQVCEKTNSKSVVDVGSGLGHLSRMLAYLYDYSVTAIEMEGQRLPLAGKFDKDLENELKRISRDKEIKFGKVRHIAKLINPNINTEEFVSLIKDKRKEKLNCVLVGLHTCGDLASTMLKVFNNTSIVKGIVSVSCCYFRMTLLEKDCSRYNAGWIENLKNRNTENTLNIQSKIDVTETEKKISSCNDNFKPEQGGVEKVSLICANSNNQTCLHFTISHLQSIYSSLNGDKSANRSYSNCKRSLSNHTGHNSEYQSQYGFPLSVFLQRFDFQPLRYKCFEVACHFVDDYIEKLMSNSPNLKLHCYRAVMEVFIRFVDPKLVMASVRCKKIKNAALLSFEEYAEKVFERLQIKLDMQLLEKINYRQLLDQWKNVVIYHSLIHLMGPVVESIALVDKWMFLVELGYSVSLVPVFDPKLSPRNFVLIATKE